jgi:hypothetical protein
MTLPEVRATLFDVDHGLFKKTQTQFVDRIAGEEACALRERLSNLRGNSLGNEDRKEAPWNTGRQFPESNLSNSRQGVGSGNLQDGLVRYGIGLGTIGSASRRFCSCGGFHTLAGHRIAAGMAGSGREQWCP